MKSHYRGHKMAVWLNLIPQLHQPGDDDVNMRHHHFYEREPHYYAGAVRAESYTRLPPLMHPASMTDSQMIGGNSGPVNTECVPQTTATDEGRDVADDIEPDDEEASEELLERLASRHYYSYTAALGVTVGVGCLLLVLNMLIFAGIYYQRERDRRRQNNGHSKGSRDDRSNSTPSTEETIPMSQRPSTPGSSARQSPLICRRDQELMEMSISYNTIPRSQNFHHATSGLASASSTLKKEKPPPPVRTSSNPAPPPHSNTGTIKKRVQIQEITV